MRVAGRVLADLAASTRFGDVHHFEEIDSTNRWVAGQAAAGAPEGLVAVADHQSAGRGRLDRRWEAPAGSGLLMSILLRPSGLRPERSHLVTAAVGLAARAACGEVGAFLPGLKWPNDLVVGDAKLAGILAEMVGGGIVVGIGMNLTWAPPGAAGAEAAAGRSIGRDRMLAATLGQLEGRLGRWDELAAEYRSACVTLGRRVRVELPGEVVEGVAEDLDGTGALVVRTAAGGPRVVTAGDVVHLRPTGAAGPGG